MTQSEALIALFRAHGNRMTLGQIMQTGLACEYRARISELRRQGYTFTLERGSKPLENIYRMIEPFNVEGNGQMRFA